MNNLRSRLLLTAAIGFAITVVTSHAADDQPYGIDERIPWTSSRITGSPEPPLPYTTERVFPKLSFEDPVTLTNAPGTDRLFVVEVNGKGYSFSNDNELEQAAPFFDLKEVNDKVTRVYGLTFHPNFAENRLCYICYVLEAEIADGTVVSRFKVSASEPPQVDPSSEEILLRWKSGGHNGGCLKFGPDGYLYVSTGDGGPAFPPDPLKSGQDVSNVRSSILRIDIDRQQDDLRYAIPSDNPFVELDGARGEVWCYGLRNPWRMSFDSETGDLWVGDVGWELWELVYRVERGANYGWSLVEGPQPVHRERTRGPTPIVEPTAKHSHIESRSITGGFVYRGTRLKDLAGSYIYGDYVTGKMWALRHDGTKVISLREIADTPLAIVCYGIDNNNELYTVAYDGTIHRLVESVDAVANEAFPATLSETGLFSSVADHVVAPGVIPYSINAEPWMDGAFAERFAAIPKEGSLGIQEVNNVQIGTIKGRWSFPKDSVLLKTISLELQPGNAVSRHRLETQILHFGGDTWRGYTYVWNDEQTDAVLAPNEAIDRAFDITDPNSPGGKRQQTWHFASRTECLLCHTTRGGSIYGFTSAQLDRDHDYGTVSDNQLRTLKHIGLTSEREQDATKRMVNPYDATGDLEARARSYLHINCAHCHRRGGGGTAAMDVQHHLSLEKTNLLKARPTQGVFGIRSAQVLLPGDPYRSVLYYRMAKLGRGRMPYIGSSVIDQRGLWLMHDWIKDVGGDLDPFGGDSSEAGEVEITALGRIAARQGDQRLHIDRLLGSTSGALRLLYALDYRTTLPTTKQLAIELGSKHSDVQIRDLFEHFLPEQQRTKRLGTAIDPQEILRLAGNGSSGRELFLSTEGVQCKNCHQIAKEGRDVGPELTAIGKKYTRQQLLESILQPSKVIDPKYVTYLIETTNGQVLTGLLVKKTEDMTVLRDAQAKEVSIPANEIEFAAPQQKSLMPELLLQEMTAQQVADLLAFLSELR